MTLKAQFAAYLFIGSLILSGTMDAEDEQQEQKNYCEMVDIHKQSNGDYGWPAYKGECE